CGRPLFARRPRPLALTESGARLFPVIRNSLDAVAEILTAVRDDPHRQPLRVTTTNAFASRWLLPRLERWRETCPDVQVDVNGTDAILDLRAGEADLAIRYAPTAPTRVVTEELFKDTYWPICNPRLLRGARRVQRPADLRRHTLIHVYWPPSFRNPPTWRRWF